MIKTVKHLAVAVISSYLLIALLLTVFQRHLLYFPTAPLERPLSEKPITLSHQGQQLNGWVINPGQPDALIYFGGNAEQIANNVDLFKAVAPNYTLYLLNYRGYGTSSGTPTETALLADALHIYDQIYPQHQRVAAMGRSLGSGIAVHLAAHRRLSQLILITPYDSITAVAQNKYPWLPIRLLLTDHYNCVQQAPKVTADTLVLVAQFDRLIPPAHADKLITHFNQPVQKVIINDSNHNNISYFPQYKQSLIHFLSN